MYEIFKGHAESNEVKMIKWKIKEGRASKQGLTYFLG